MPFLERVRLSKEVSMPVYMADRFLPGITMEQLAAAQKAAIETGTTMTSQGKPVRYIRSTFVPSESRCMCLFEAPDSGNVRELNETAKIPFTRIVEAEDLTPV
jgi:muconolactone delta-isomerase